MPISGAENGIASTKAPIPLPWWRASDIEFFDEALRFHGLQHCRLDACTNALPHLTPHLLRRSLHLVARRGAALGGPHHCASDEHRHLGRYSPPRGRLQRRRAAQGDAARAARLDQRAVVGALAGTVASGRRKGNSWGTAPQVVPCRDALSRGLTYFLPRSGNSGRSCGRRRDYPLCFTEARRLLSASVIVCRSILFLPGSASRQGRIAQRAALGLGGQHYPGQRGHARRLDDDRLWSGETVFLWQHRLRPRGRSVADRGRRSARCLP